MSGNGNKSTGEKRIKTNGGKCLVSAAFLMSQQAAGVPDRSTIGGGRSRRTASQIWYL